MSKIPLSNVVINSLLERIALGDRQAFDLFDSAVRSFLVHRIRQAVRDHHLAEDLAQDVMLKLWRLRHQFDPTKNGFAWTLRIATTTAIDHFRKSKLRIRDNQDVDRISDDLERTDPATSGPDHTCDEAVREAIKTLPASERVAVELRLDGQTFDAIGRTMGIHMLAARRRYLAGLVHLRDALTKSLTA